MDQPIDTDTRQQRMLEALALARDLVTALAPEHAPGAISADDIAGNMGVHVWLPGPEAVEAGAALVGAPIIRKPRTSETHSYTSLDVHSMISGIPVRLSGETDQQLLRPDAPASEASPPLAEDDVARCASCGCTEDSPCEGGCAWVPNPAMTDLCSACASPVLETAQVAP